MVKQDELIENLDDLDLENLDIDEDETEVVEDDIDLDDLDLDDDEEEITEESETKTEESGKSIEEEIDDLDIDFDDEEETEEKPETKSEETELEDLDESIDDLDLDEEEISEEEISEETETKSEETDFEDIDLDEEIDLEEEIDLDDEPEIEPEVKSENGTDVEFDDLELQDKEVSNADNEAEELKQIKTPIEKEVEEDEIFDEIDLDEEETEEKPVVEQKELLPEVVEKPKTEIPVSITNERRKKNTKAKPRTTIYNPAFLLSKITDDRYQIRSTKRTPEELQDLADKISVQGQVEPVQILKLGKEYFPLAGFGRIEAVRDILKKETIKAIILEGLNEKEIMQICTGSNEARIELSDWDKIISVGQYWEKNGYVSVDDKYNPNSLVNVFGYSRSQLNSYLTMYKFYKDRTFLKELYNEIRCPLYIYQVVMKVIKSLPNNDYDDKKIAKFIENTVKNPELTKQKFVQLFSNFMTDYSVALENNADINEEFEIDDNITETSAVINIDEGKLKEVQDEIAKNTVTVDKSMDKMLVLLKDIKAECLEMENVPEYKKYIKRKKKQLLLKRYNALNDVISKFL